MTMERERKERTVADVFADIEAKIAATQAELRDTSGGDHSVYYPLRARLAELQDHKQDLEIVYGGHFDRSRERDSWWVVKSDAAIPKAKHVDYTPYSWGGTGADYGGVVAANEGLEEGDFLIEYCPAHQNVPEDSPAATDRIYLWQVSGLLGLGTETGRYLMAVGPESLVSPDVRKRVQTRIPGED